MVVFISLSQALISCGLVLKLVSTLKCVKPQTSPCSCETDQGLIDLSQLYKEKKTPRFSGQDSKSQGYYYDPCQTFSMGSSNECSNVLGCASSADNTNHYPLTTGNTSKFQTGDVTSTGVAGFELYYMADAPDCTNSGGQRQLHVMLQCSKGETTFNVTGEYPPGQCNYVLILSSPFCCPAHNGPVITPGLSAGSVLLIIFFLSVLLYLILGGLYMSLIKDARGVEIVPNLTFWTSLPGLMIDGFNFIVKCGKVDHMYGAMSK